MSMFFKIPSRGSVWGMCSCCGNNQSQGGTASETLHAARLLRSPRLLSGVTTGVPGQRSLPLPLHQDTHSLTGHSGVLQRQNDV